MESFKKPTGKSVTYTITEDTRKMLQHMRESININAEDNPYYQQLKSKLDSLDPYDQNLLLAYFAFDRLSDLSKTLGVSSSVILTKIKKLLKCLSN